MSDLRLLVIIVLSLLLIASLLFCFLLLRKLKGLQSQQNRWRAESRRWQDLQGSFLANMSHELRTPLTVIKGYVDLMNFWASSDGLGIKYRDALATMDRNERFLEDLLNSILNFSKIKVGLRPIVKEPADIDGIFSDMLPGLKDKAKKENLSLRVYIHPSVPKLLYLDFLAVRQIIRNLMENAVKFTSQGGITMEAKWKPTAGNTNEGELEISVTDTGIGIAASDLDRIFEPFTQAESSMSRRYGGTGLGLSISRSLTENMGGTLTVNSRPGAGSRFELHLPVRAVADRELRTRVSPRMTASRSGHAPKRILLVEDSQDTRELLREFLGNLSVEVASAENGKEAIDVVTTAEKERQAFDVILMDIQMPVMNGFQATRILRQRGYQKPIIALTAHNLQGDREKCLESGCSDYVSKPIDLRVLREKLEAA